MAKTGWLALLLALALALNGCSGVLYETKNEDGSTDRVVVDSGEGWSSYDTNPKFSSDVKKKGVLDDLSIMLKKEATF